jgi:hypothetical protein
VAVLRLHTLDHALYAMAKRWRDGLETFIGWGWVEGSHKLRLFGELPAHTRTSLAALPREQGE